MRPRSMFALALAVAASTGLSACGKGVMSTNPVAPHASQLADPGTTTAGAVARPADEQMPDFDPSDFVAHVTHPYLPLTPGTHWSYVGQTPEGTETDEIEVTHDTKLIVGTIHATVVRDRVFLNGVLKEDTFDWYGQDEDGNVWYLGEDTKEYENGEVVSTFGSWEAGVNGGRAGIIMLAHPRTGDDYQQEFMAGVAEDRARVMAVNKTARVPFGTFRDCIQTRETTPLEPNFRESKYYARGIGVVLEVSNDGERVELVGFSQ